jgi:hypothetical protein
MFLPFRADRGMSPQTFTPGVTTMLVAVTQEDVVVSQYCRIVFESALVSGRQTLTSVLEEPPPDVEVIEMSPYWVFPRSDEPTPESVPSSSLNVVANWSPASPLGGVKLMLPQAVGVAQGIPDANVSGPPSKVWSPMPEFIVLLPLPRLTVIWVVVWTGVMPGRYALTYVSPGIAPMNPTLQLPAETWQNWNKGMSGVMGGRPVTPIVPAVRKT